jgi:hypothetical protein
MQLLIVQTQVRRQERTQNGREHIDTRKSVFRTIAWSLPGNYRASPSRKNSINGSML